MKTAVVTDTNSGITVEAGKKLGIYVLPMPVIVEDSCYLEGEDITNAELYGAMKNHREVSSSQPSPGSILSLWNAVFKDGFENIVYIPMSSSLSGSCENAMQLSADYQGRVHVVDNHRISVTLMESVYDAKRLADSGHSAKEIKTMLEDSAYDASIYLSVNSLEYLKKSGRITASAAAIAGILNIKPVLTIQGDKLDLFAKVRGIKQSERKMIEALNICKSFKNGTVKQDIASRFAGIPAGRLRIATAGTFEKEEEAEAWRGLVQSEFPHASVYYVPLSCSIACHVGVGALGIGVSILLAQ